MSQRTVRQDAAEWVQSEEPAGPRWAVAFFAGGFGWLEKFEPSKRLGRVRCFGVRCVM